MGSTSVSYCRICCDIICNNRGFILFIGTWKVYYCIVNGWCVLLWYCFFVYKCACVCMRVLVGFYSSCILKYDVIVYMIDSIISHGICSNYM